ncbi:MAG TPA: Hsp20/alpha crystallin family protein [Desulfonauticus sp.]|jgi:HSP20 family molecular chaperone IbpA|nr:MAG: Heat shock protein Hsp20 [Desulfonauticus sp. 38_4375]MDK2922533.1 hypothetical protein [Desulfonauticus sp.]HCO12008.1 Hsp20/alpha crystallin family protein [Desulfonauticus sp.]
MTEAVVQKNRENIPIFSPYTDILEKEEGFYILLDLPGVGKEDVELNLKENELEIRAKARIPEQEKVKNIHLEFVPGEYRRQFTLSEVVDKENIKASLKNGVLTLFLPKAQEAKPKKIEISAE